MSLINFIQNHDKLLQSDELIFFGGSFNPWHQGHASCIDLMPSNKIIIVIHDHNPHKLIAENIKAFNPAQDLAKELTKLKNKAYLFSEFYQMNLPNPTIDWITKVSMAFPNKKLSLLIGHDSFLNIHKWTKAPDLLNTLSTLYVASRLDDVKLQDHQLQQLISINPNLKIIFLGHHPHEHLSSTKLRNF